MAYINHQQRRLVKQKPNHSSHHRLRALGRARRGSGGEGRDAFGGSGGGRATAFGGDGMGDVRAVVLRGRSSHSSDHGTGAGPASASEGVRRRETRRCLVQAKELVVR
jgi:hypothetical protein